jgi:hypothetical protein
MITSGEKERPYKAIPNIPTRPQESLPWDLTPIPPPGSAPIPKPLTIGSGSIARAPQAPRGAPVSVRSSPRPSTYVHAGTTPQSTVIPKFPRRGSIRITRRK